MLSAAPMKTPDSSFRERGGGRGEAGRRDASHEGINPPPIGQLASPIKLVEHGPPPLTALFKNRQ